MELKSATQSFPDKKTNILWLVAIFIATLSTYILLPATTSTDSRWTFYISMSMLREQNADLDEYAHLMEDRDFRVLYIDDHIQSYFPLGVSIVNVPYVWVMDQVFDLRYPTDFADYLQEHFPDQRLAKIEKIAASIISTLAAVMFFTLVSQRLRKLYAALLTLIFALLTPMLSTASRALWQHGLSALCLILVLWLLLHPTAGRQRIFLAGFLLGFSYVVRPTNSLSVAFVSLYILFNHRRDLLLWIGGLSIPLLLLVIHGLQSFHSILPPYYLPQHLGINSDFFSAALGNLVSPNRGLFTTTPILLFSMIGIFLLIKKKRMNLKNIELYLAIILLVHWITISSFDNWPGGWSLGPRFFTDVIPYLAWFLVPVFEENHLWTLRWWRIAFSVAILVSGLTHFSYVTSDYPMFWNEKPESIVHYPQRSWDFTDLQVLRGTCEDKLEGPAPLCWFHSGESQ